MSETVGGLRMAMYGERKSRRVTRNLLPHELLDEERPSERGITWLGRFILRPMMLGLYVLIAWLLQSLAPSWWGFTILAGAAIVFLHRAMFRLVLIIRDEPLDPRDRRRFWPRQIRTAALRIGPELVMWLALVLSVILDLAGAAVGGNIAWCIAAVAALAGGLLLGRWYVSDIRQRYELLREFKVESLSELPGEAVPRFAVRLASVFTDKDLANLQKLAEEHFATITNYDLVGSSRSAEFTAVTAAERKVYEDIERNIGKPVWEWNLEFEWVENTDGDRDKFPERIETLTLHRYPVGGLFDADREKFWRSIIRALPKGSNGWKVDDRQDVAEKVLTYGPPLALPEIVRMSDVVTGYDPTLWNRIDIGKDGEGSSRGVDLIAGPHTLIIGPTGSGKTMALLMHAAQAMARGHEVIVIDPLKAGVDFAPVRSRLKLLAKTYQEAAQTALRIYAEVKRRKQLLIDFDKGRWDRLPVHVLASQGVRPLTVIIDEYASLVIPIVVTKDMSKYLPSEEVEELEEANAAKAIIKNQVEKIAREARFVGIHLAIAAQRPDAKILEGEFRNQLTSAVLAVAPSSPPKPEPVRMMFPDAGAEVSQVVADLDNGKPGLAIIGAEGGGVTGIRVGFSPDDEIGPYLDSIGIPPSPDPWTLDGGFDPGQENKPEATNIGELSQLDAESPGSPVSESATEENTTTAAEPGSEKSVESDREPEVNPKPKGRNPIFDAWRKQSVEPREETDEQVGE